MRLLSAAFAVITRVEELSLIGGILGIASLTILNVLLRAVTGESLLFVGEINRFLIVFVTFLGIGYGASQGRHIRMTALYDMLGPRPRKAAMIVICAGTSALLFTLTWLSLRYIFGTVRVLGPVSPVLRVPLYLIYLSAPIGFFLGALQYLLALLRNLFEPGIYVSFERHDGYDESPPLEI